MRALSSQGMLAIVLCVTGMLRAQGTAVVPKPPAKRLEHFTIQQAAQRFNFPENEAEGQTIGIIGCGSPKDFSLNLKLVREDLEKRGCPVPAMELIRVDFPENSGNSGELHLDAIIIATLAPKAKVRIYVTTWDKLDKAIRRGTDDGCSVLSFSFGHPQGPWDFTWKREAIDAVDAALAHARDHFVTVCIASGDSGAGRVAYPASSPWALAVGGVCMDVGAARARAWENSGGGVSKFPVPDYQIRIHPTSFPDAEGHTHVGRGVPDVAGFAAGFDHWNGTSAAAPFWAALIARINTGLGHRVGFINAIIYEPEVSAKAFHDIVDGDNIPTNEKYPAKGYHAGPGWDACTGLGTPNGKALMDALGAATK